MYNVKYILYIIAFIAGLLFSKVVSNCSGEDGKTKIVIPEKVGTFIKPDTIIKHDIKTQFIYKKDTIELENPVNEEMAYEYLSNLDTISKLKLYLKAIEEKEENYVFNDSNVSIDIFTKTRGKILNIKPTYKIKEQEITIPQKKTLFAIYTGGEVLNSTDGSGGLGVKLNVIVQNNKGILFTGGVDSNKNIYLGTSIRILNIEK